jgi:hypothetical protein
VKPTKCLASMERERFSERVTSFPGKLLLSLHVFSWFNETFVKGMLNKC